MKSYSKHAQALLIRLDLSADSMIAFVVRRLAAVLQLARVFQFVFARRHSQATQRVQGARAHFPSHGIVRMHALSCDVLAVCFHFMYPSIRYLSLWTLPSICCVNAGDDILTSVASHLRTLIDSSDITGLIDVLVPSGSSSLNALEACWSLACLCDSTLAAVQAC